MLFCYIISISFSNQPIVTKKKNLVPILLIFIAIIIKGDESFLEFKNIKLNIILTTLYTKNINLTFFLLALLLFVIARVIFLTENKEKRLKI